MIPEGLLRAFGAANAGQMQQAAQGLDACQERTIEQVVKKHPDYANTIYVLMGMTLRRMVRAQEAEAWFKRIPEDQATALIFNELAVLYQNTA